VVGFYREGAAAAAPSVFFFRHEAFPRSKQTFQADIPSKHPKQTFQAKLREIIINPRIPMAPRKS
jgi:hypothetical protein